MEYLLLNGKICDIRDFNPSELFLRTAIFVQEEMWFDNGEIRFFGFHQRNLNAFLGYSGKPAAFDQAGLAEFHRLLKRLINKNKAFMGGWLSVAYYFDKGITEYYARVRQSPGRTLPFDPRGKLATIAPYGKVISNPLNFTSFFSRCLWTAERFRISGTKWEESVFLNDKRRVTEALGSNIYCISGKRLITPSAATGCFLDPLREPVMQAANKLGYRIAETDSLSPEELPEMEEIFTVSEAEGFKWIMGLDTRRFIKAGAIAIREQLDSDWPLVSVE